MKKYFYIIYNPKRLFVIIDKKKPIWEGIFIWLIYNCWYYFLIIINKENFLPYNLTLYYENILINLLLNTFLSFLSIVFLSLIIHLLSNKQKTKQKFKSLIIVMLFLSLVEFIFIPIQILALLINLPILFKLTVCFISIWQLILILISIHTIYKLSYKKVLFLGLSSIVLYVILITIFYIIFRFINILPYITKKNNIQYEQVNDRLIFELQTKEYSFLDNKSVNIKIKAQVSILDINLFKRRISTYHYLHSILQNYIDSFITSELLSIESKEFKVNKKNEIKTRIIEECNDLLEDKGVKIINIYFN